MKITLFSQWECKTCVELKEKLKEEKITYKIIEVLDHKELWKEIRERQLQLEPKSIMYTPTLLVESNGVGVYISAGRDFDGVEEALNKLKEYL
jgi:glutaredoxin